MKLYVDINAKPNGDGSIEKPFSMISEAARVAEPGDEVLVYPGIYREEVSPNNAGTEKAPIVYTSVEPLKAVITGAEVITEWEQYEGTVWVARLPKNYFGTYNPYTTYVYGDWLNVTVPVHTGEVYLGEKSLYEVPTLEQVLNPVINDCSWDKEFTVYTWYTCCDEQNGDVLIYANFHDKDPRDGSVEINVRPHCFYPASERVNYITLSGFTVTKAATQWAPPTALQDGMIGPHWSKGWIIENCDISHSKCSGISLGKYKQEGNDNRWSKKKTKDGAQTQRDCAFIARSEGWSKETVGSHIIRNCNIHDCGQTGIVGNLGSVFSIIENNHIHNINNKRNLAGAEIGGIKLHAAIDVIIRNNHFHHCTRGIWLDWQAQGTRVTGNLFHDNCMPYDYLLTDRAAEGLGVGEDLWIEVSHGPTLVDNNIMLSDRALKIAAQGIAVVHNFIAGSISGVNRGANNGTEVYASPRYTPIHKPHSTDITGVMTILHGDMRFYNNIFVQKPIRPGMQAFMDASVDNEWDDSNIVCGTVPYTGFMTEETWESHFEGYCGEGAPGTRDKYYMPLPVWTGGNVFFNGAKPCDIEKDYVEDTEHELIYELKEENGKLTLVTNAEKYLPNAKLIDTAVLGEAFEPEEAFETPDGEPIVFDTDFYGNKRTNIKAGPF